MELKSVQLNSSQEQEILRKDSENMYINLKKKKKKQSYLLKKASFRFKHTPFPMLMLPMNNNNIYKLLVAHLWLC